MYERTLAMEIPLDMLREIDDTINELYEGELTSVYDDRLPRTRVAFVHKGKLNPIMHSDILQDFIKMDKPN